MFYIWIFTYSFDIWSAQNHSQHARIAVIRPLSDYNETQRDAGEVQSSVLNSTHIYHKTDYVSPYVLEFDFMALLSPLPLQKFPHVLNYT